MLPDHELDAPISFCELNQQQCLQQRGMPFKKVRCDYYYDDVGKQKSSSENTENEEFTNSAEDELTETYYHRIVDNSQCENKGISIISMVGKRGLQVLKNEKVLLGNYSRQKSEWISQACHCQNQWQGEFCQWEETTVGSCYIILGSTSVLIAVVGIRAISKKKKKKKQKNKQNKKVEEEGVLNIDRAGEEGEAQRILWINYVEIRLWKLAVYGNK